MSHFKNEKDKLEAAANHLLSFAVKSGAEHAEVCASYGTKNKISLEKLDYHLASTDDGYSLGLRVLKGQRQGFASCNTTETSELKEVALKANEIAGFSPENPHFGIFASDNIPNEAPKSIVDPQLVDLSLQTQKDWTKLMVGQALKDKRFRLNEGSFEISSGLSLLLNSLGTRKFERDTVAAWSLMGMGVEGETITSFDYFSHISRIAAQTPDKIITSSKNFVDEVLKNLKTGKSESYKGLVVFSPRAVLEILVSSLCYHLNGRVVVEGTGKWKTADLGKKVLSPQISLTDNPWLVDRMGYTTFDREGTPTRPMSLIESGVLNAFCMDHYSAKALKMSTTGHAAGGSTSIPSVSTHNISLLPGTESKFDLMNRVTTQQKNFLYVNRYSGQTDPVTGDFSGVAKGAEWWVGNERAYCVQETLISGNLFEALAKTIFGISKETEVVDCGEESPTLVLDNISVTGG